MIQYWLLIILGFVFLILGSKLLVDGASEVAKKFKISELLIGLTIVAIGTSAPETMVAIVSSSKGANNLILGNIIGSNFCNLLFTMGIITLIKPVKIDKDARRIHLPVAFLGAILLLIMGSGFLDSEKYLINRVEGLILIIIFAIYFIYPIVKEVSKIKEKCEEDKKNNKKTILLFAVIKIIVGAILLKYGGDFVVDNAKNIAKALDLSDRVIGLTVVALGTALPEFVTSLTATIKGNTNLAVGNLVGSCVFNMFFIIGLAAVISPIRYLSNFTANILLMVISIFLVWLFNYIRTKNSLNREQGFILVFIYVVYILSLFI